MRLVFAGTPAFAATALLALHEAGHTIVQVLTQPDRPAGRGLKLTPSAVKQVASRLALPLAQPLTLKNADAQHSLRALDFELMVVAAYGLILPQGVLGIPPRGCINIHASLLPRWRGAAPIQRAILAGDRETGITLMQMDAGLDTGAMLSHARIAIAPDDTTASLHDKLARLGASSVVAALSRLDALRAQPQDDAQATYAAKIDKAEARLDWRQDAAVLARQVRAYNPYPGAFTSLRGETVKIWKARANAEAPPGAPGTLRPGADGGWNVVCGSGTLHLVELQAAGGKRMGTDAFMSGHGFEAQHFDL